MKMDDLERHAHPATVGGVLAGGSNVRGYHSSSMIHCRRLTSLALHAIHTLKTCRIVILAGAC